MSTVNALDMDLNVMILLEQPVVVLLLPYIFTPQLGLYSYLYEDLVYSTSYEIRYVNDHFAFQ